MHIVCASDENLVMAAAVMLKSLFVNVRPGRPLSVHFLDGGISDASKARLLASLEPHAGSVRFVKVDPQPLSDMTITGHITVVAYYRFLLPSLLPTDVRKTIYLDADMVVSGDISELWDTDMNGKHLLAVPEQGRDGANVSGPGSLAHYRKVLGFAPHQKVFNSGVMLIDMEKWRRDQITTKLIGYVKQHRDRIRYWDQDALNVVLAQQWGELDCRWNVLTQFFDCFPWDAGVVKDRGVYRRLVQRPAIVHFNTVIKPWQALSLHPKTSLFYHYLDMTQWQGWRPRHYRVYRLLAPLRRALVRIARTGVLRKLRLALGHRVRQSVIPPPG